MSFYAPVWSSQSLSAWFKGGGGPKVTWIRGWVTSHAPAHLLESLGMFLAQWGGVGCRYTPPSRGEQPGQLEAGVGWDGTRVLPGLQGREEGCQSSSQTRAGSHAEKHPND